MVLMAKVEDLSFSRTSGVVEEEKDGEESGDFS